MNAKKIMGAVLVALLAAALFTGAVAAADKGTYFAYQTHINETLNGVWMNGDNKVTIAGGNMSAVSVAGTYTKGDDSIYVTNPTATYSAIGNYSGTKYIISNGGNVYLNSKVTVVATALNTSMVPDVLRVESPNGAVEYVAVTSINEKVFDKTGTFKIQAVWNDSTTGNFTTGAPFPVVDSAALTFTVVKPSDATITGSVDTVYAGDAVSVTIKGTPGEKYAVNLTGFNKTANGQNLNQIVVLEQYGWYNFSFQMPSAGEVTLQFVTDSNAEDEVKLALTEDGKTTVLGEVVVAIAAPELTVTLGASSYFIGNEIKVIGTSNIAVPDDAYTFNITGTNFPETELPINTVDTEYDGKTFTVYLKTADVNASGKKLDVGTYTIKMYDSKLVKTIAVALKQPFISIIEAPEVVVQGTEAEFLINAEAATGVNAYIFGTNYFMPLTGDDDDDAKNEFTVTLKKDQTNASVMAAGQYFAVFQHPMYDGDFNIKYIAAKKAFYLNTSGTATGTDTYLFSVNDRQTANAAQALCDALESQNIDDMYVKASFFVVGQDESFSISAIPTEVAQGETITISGVDTASEEGTPVTVEMISTAFAAVPKETVGSAAFIVVTTEVAEDGTWEITLDTSDLNVDEYSLSVAIGDDVKKNVKINVVEGAETPDTPDTPDVPDTPDTPDTPTEPTTPGFGALAALAGLGAVAVLLLRRE